MISLSSLARKKENHTKIVVGSVVSTNLYGLGRGVVYRISGEQGAHAVEQSGVANRGDRAVFDIVHECGKFSHRLPECILRGAQWTIFDEKADGEEIARLRTRAQEQEAQRKREEEEHITLFNAEVQRLRAAPEYAHLEQGDCSSGKLAAKNIRRELKQFNGVKFSVRNPHYGSVDVKWQDGPTQEKVDAIIKKYKNGHFDAMQDIYEYSSSPFNTVFGSAQYPSGQRSYSDAMIGKAIDKIISAYDLKFDIVPTADDYRTGKLWKEKCENFHQGLQSKIYAVLSEME